jgi:hypothetical protein
MKPSRRDDASADHLAGSLQSPHRGIEKWIARLKGRLAAYHPMQQGYQAAIGVSLGCQAQDRKQAHLQ